MTTTANAKNRVANLISGSDVPLALERLSQCGRQGTDAILDAMEGKGVPTPENRHSRDLDEALLVGLQAIAKVNPSHLITALERRPEHTFSLIWALGSSREEAAVHKLIEHAKDNDPWVRWAAVSGLARLRRKSILQPLLDALRDRSGSVRFAALEGLVRVADRTAIEPLKHFLGDKRLQPGGRRIASELLYKLEKGGRPRSSGRTKHRT